MCCKLAPTLARQMWRHNYVIGRNEYPISTLAESTSPWVYSLQFLLKSTHHSLRYERKCEWVFFSEHSVVSWSLQFVGCNEILWTSLTVMIAWWRWTRFKHRSNQVTENTVDGGVRASFVAVRKAEVAGFYASATAFANELPVSVTWPAMNRTGTWGVVAVTATKCFHPTTVSRNTDVLTVFEATTAVFVHMRGTIRVITVIGIPSHTGTVARTSDILFVLVTYSAVRVIHARHGVAIAVRLTSRACTVDTDVATVGVTIAVVFVMRTCSSVAVIVWSDAATACTVATNGRFVLITRTSVRMIWAVIWVAVTNRWLYAIVARSGTADEGVISVTGALIGVVTARSRGSRGGGGGPITGIVGTGEVVTGKYGAHDDTQNKSDDESTDWQKSWHVAELSRKRWIRYRRYVCHNCTQTRCRSKPRTQSVNQLFINFTLFKIKTKGQSWPLTCQELTVLKRVTNSIHNKLVNVCWALILGLIQRNTRKYTQH